MDQAGELEQGSIGLILKNLHQAKASGMLHLETPEQKTWIYVLEGAPACVYNPNAEVYLGMLLQELGYIDMDVFNQSLMRMAESGMLQGQVLLDMGAVDEEQLQRALSLQVLRKAAGLFSIAQGRYRFDPDGVLPDRMEPHPVPFEAVTYQGIRNHFDAAALERHLAPLAGKMIGAGPTTMTACAQIQFEADEKEDLGLLSQHRSLEDFAHRARAGETAARMIALALYWCDQLLISEPGQAPAALPHRPAPAGGATSRPVPAAAAPEKKQTPAPGPSSAAKQKLIVVPAELRALVNAIYKKAVDKDLLGMLDCTADTSPEQMKEKHQRQIAIFHPDRYVKFQDRELTLRVQRIAAALNEARTIIDDPQKRIDYLNYALGAGPRPMTISPEAGRAAHKKGEVYLQKKDLQKALDSFKLASRLDPRNIDSRARQIWVEHMLAETSDSGSGVQTMRKLLKLFELANNNFLVNRQLAILCGRLGQAAEQERYLQRAQRIRPDDIDNNRDLRLIEMRRRKNPAR